jgi:hypothetical protein
MIVIKINNINLGICIAPTQSFRAALGGESRVCCPGNMVDRQTQWALTYYHLSLSTANQNGKLIHWDSNSWSSGCWCTFLTTWPSPTHTHYCTELRIKTCGLYVSFKLPPPTNIDLCPHLHKKELSYLYSLSNVQLSCLDVCILSLVWCVRCWLWFCLFAILTPSCLVLVAVFISFVMRAFCFLALVLLQGILLSLFMVFLGFHCKRLISTVLWFLFILPLLPPAVKTQCLSQCQAFQRLVRSSHTLVNWILCNFWSTE